MNARPQTTFRLFLISTSLVLLGLLFAEFIGKETTSGLHESQKINLALRRTAHHLLRAAGDSTSRIPAVQQPDPRTFRVQLARSFDYDKLPGLLRQSLAVHRITGGYDVAVLDCATNQLQLGYNVADLLGKDADKDSVACGGRSMTAGCYVLQVSFDTPISVAQPKPVWPFLALGGLLTGFLVLVWRRQTEPLHPPQPPFEPETQPQPVRIPEDTNRLCFGRSTLDVSNQILAVGEETHNLTYRETKLLRVFVNHANQVMERDRILDLVWADEGITVGRSVDVFVSRLRKLLQNDPLIKIVAVHGVGYRMEVLPG
jgi:hypothetical protein